MYSSTYTHQHLLRVNVMNTPTGAKEVVGPKGPRAGSNSHWQVVLSVLPELIILGETT